MRKIVGALILIGLLIGVGVAYAVVAQQYVVPQSGTISDVIAVTIDGQLWSNNQPMDWGQLSRGVIHTVPMQVKNIGSNQIIVTFVVTDLPPNWVETWEKNGATIEPGMSVLGDISLTVPINSESGQYDWTMTIVADIT